jgi:ferredoxin--NADP+ reductase
MLDSSHPEPGSSEPVVPGFSPTRVVAVERWADGLSSLRLQARREFLAGQFFQLALPLDGVVIKRSYSAASAPGEPLEFIVSAVPSGQLSPTLARLSAGDPLWIDPKPLGFFTMEEVPESRTLWLVSTGTGLGPTMSWLRQGQIFERFSRVCVVHGTRASSHFAYRAELEAQVEARGGALVYLRVLSAGDAAASSALPGRVTSSFASGALEQAAGLPIDEHSHVLLCGNPAMIDEMSELLRGRGLRKHRRREPGHFNFEKYW